jgi:cardiolipin synthase
MTGDWTSGNRFALLENGEMFFPRVFEVIGQAREEVLIETFILFEDKVGHALHAVLLDVARRGVKVSVLVDGYGSIDLSRHFLDELTEAGVVFHLFDPRPKLFGMRTNVFRRMHRKLVVVDGETAFVGGLNFSADHLGDFGPRAKQDYAVEVHGPIVAQIHDFARRAAEPSRSKWQRLRRRPPVQQQAGDAQALFVTRDNEHHHTDIEQQYRIAIRAARHEVVIANAYFFPGYRLLRDMRNAARRGVRVTLILQGQPDMPIVKVAAHMLHDYLLGAGVRIFEYCERPLHGKVAVADDEWATVGSSNLDPLSLSLNLEANVVIRDTAFNHHLRERLGMLMDCHCQEVTLAPADKKQRLWRTTMGFFVFHFLRRFPAWAGWLPAHTPKLTTVAAPQQAMAEAADVSPQKQA